MPLSPLRPCAAPGCPALVTRGKCAVHAVRYEHERYNYDVRRWYRRARWCHPVFGVRVQVLKRDAYTCQACKQVTLEAEVDHIVKHNGDEQLFYDMHNCQVLCRSCHSAKTARGE